MKNLILFLFILTFSSQFSIAQSDNWNLEGYTPPEEIEIIDNLDEAKDYLKGELIFSKARGVFSISPINTINNRALLKLKSEASMRGASHIFIDYRNIENSAFSKTAVYSARIFKENKFNLNEIQAAVKDKKLYIRQEIKYNRNGSKASARKSEDFFDLQVNDVSEKNGAIILNLRTVNYKSGKFTQGEEFEVIGFEGNRLLISSEKSKHTSLIVLGLEIQ